MAYGAFSWSLLFAAVHLYWGLGGRVGLGDVAAADEAFQRPLFAAFNALAGAALLGLAALVLLIARARIRRSGRGVERLVLWAAGVLLLARGGVGIVQWLASTPTDAEVITPSLALYDLWFLLGGALHTALAWLAARGAGK